MAEINKRNIIKSSFPTADCKRVNWKRIKGRQYYLVFIGRGSGYSRDPIDSTEMVAVGESPQQAWAKAYDVLREQGRLK